MKTKHPLMPIWIVILLGLLAAAAIVFAVVWSAPADAAKEKVEPVNSFMGGYDHAKKFLAPYKPRGKNFRKRIIRIETLYLGHCDTYMPDFETECLIRVLVESDGHEGTRTKDTTAREAGATSIGYDQAVTLCEEYGVCGDPCWDREYAVGAFAWLLYHDRKTLLEKSKWWSDWLWEACARGRSECELIIALNLDVNSGKVEKVMKHVGAKNAKHPWGHTISWFRKQTDSALNKMFSPIAVPLRKFGIRWGFTRQKQKIRAERNGGKYLWGPVLEEPPAKPPSMKPLPSEKAWRKECHLHKTKKWFLTHPTMSKKNQKKYIKKLGL